jgi:hypothetical protein
MKDLKHTKGEWIVDTNDEYVVRVISPWSNDVTTENFKTFADYRGAHICEMHYNTGVPSKSQAIANAKIISACPVMLKALIRIDNLIEELDGDFGIEVGSEEHKLIIEAIKKATE